MSKSTADTNRELAAGLSNNLSRLLREFSRDFERRIWRGLVQRGYQDIRPSHSAVLANLGLGLKVASSLFLAVALLAAFEPESRSDDEHPGENGQ